MDLYSISSTLVRRTREYYDQLDRLEEHQFAIERYKESVGKVQPWLDTLELDEPPSKHTLDQMDEDEHMSEASTDHLPNTPPLTTDVPTIFDLPMTPVPLGFSPKRSIDGMNDDKAGPGLKPHGNQPKRPRATLKTHLEELQKPVLFRTLPAKRTEASELLPLDVRGLYLRLKEIDTKGNKTVPSEVRQEMEEFEQLNEECFRVASGEVGASTQAKGTFQKLCTIQQYAMETSNGDRHETAWNQIVHFQLLALVFTLNLPSSGPPNPSQPRVKVRFEPAAGATITASSKPGGYVAYSASKATGSDKTSQLPSKKIDYVLVLDSAEDQPLFMAIKRLINFYGKVRGEHPHVNQTQYSALKYSPIAVAIETKRMSSDGASVQLGMWTAAWHQRMSNLRKVWVSKDLHPNQLPDQSQPLLVSLPLIQVVGHKWDVSFACDTDHGESITVYGNLPIGSTETLSSIYKLVSSLEEIRDWITENFRTKMESWFMCDPAPSVPAAQVA